MNLFSMAAIPIALLICRVGFAEPQAPPPFRISVDVNLVMLNITVSDRTGKPAPELRQQDFQVYEDGVLQSIQLFRHEDTPVTVGLVVDHSGSMRRKLPEVAVATRTFVESSSPEDEMFVVNFNEHVTLGLPEALPLSNRPDVLARAVANAPATGQTALYDAIFEAQSRLQAGSRDKKVLILISDGGDNASAHTLVEVLNMSRRSNVLMYAIGIFDGQDPDRNPGILKRLAQATGGQAFFPGQLNEVAAICERIAREIRQQYSIGYFPNHNSAKPGAYRAIRVTAAGRSKLIVRTRAGYVAANTPAPPQATGIK
jgi:Ca-activated chloride channel family protein